MANEEHVERLKAGVEGWNEWRKDNLELVPDLSGADLTGTYLIDAHLGFADLTRANLAGANLRMADLGGAYLADADITDTDITDTDITDTDLTSAVLVVAKLAGANFARADLSQAIFAQAGLAEADFSSVTVCETIFSNVNLSKTKGLETFRHIAQSSVDYHTLARSGPLPLSFLRGVGFSDEFIQYIPSLFGKGIEFYSCFISYNHADKDFARRLYDALQGRGIRCWLDEKQMLPGEDIYEGIEHGIRMWDKVLLCASENSLKSWWVDNEIDSAFEKERKLMKRHGKKTYSLIPLNLDGHIFTDDWQSGKKRQVQSRIAADFTDWKTDHDKFEAEVEKVIAALRSDGGGKAPPPEPKFGVE